MWNRLILFSLFLFLILIWSCNKIQPLQPTAKPTYHPQTLASSDDPATVWNQLTTELGLKAKLPPPRTARAYALVQVAIYDAIVNHLDGYQPPRALAAGAGSVVLNYLFPGDVQRIKEVTDEQIQLSVGPNSGLVNAAYRIGRGKGHQTVSYAKHDGSDAVFVGPPPSGDCIWTGVNPVLPLCGEWKTWIIIDGGEFQPPPPYPCGSEADLQDLQEVYDVSFNRTAEQIAIVHKWADLPPPTIWNGYLAERVTANNLSELASARAYAYLNMAMYDAFVCCWKTKYTYWTARPFMRLPADFTTVITTPNFPSYSSGHSTISGAAAEVMGEIFPAQLEFFRDEALEAANSRLWGGIHYRQDNENGLVVGKKIGEKVVDVMQTAGNTPILGESLTP